MTAARRKPIRSFAFFVALATAFALVPLAGVAQADPDNTAPALDVTVETETNALTAFTTLTATTAAAPAGGTEIDFEIDCTSGCSGLTYSRTGTTGNVAGANAGGSTTFPPDTPTDGDQAAATVDDTRDSPELSCTILVGATTCLVSYSRAGSAGSDLIAGWVDNNKTNETNDSDTTEGLDAATAQGATTDPDDTDVVQRDWFTAASANVKLDCDDDDQLDTETNAPGASETYTCFAFNDAATGTTADDVPVAGALIDAENLADANDPDNSLAAGTADFNNACTTAADGKCTFVVAASENETGVANFCFWIDEDNDTGFDSGGAEFDGGLCDLAGEWTAGYDVSLPTPDEYPATSPSANKTDPVQLTWATPVATNLDATPERDANVKGTAHTVSATVTDQFGGFVSNSLVDFVVTGANVGQGCNNVVTNASGVATCTYTDSTTIVGVEPEIDTIDVSVDASGAADATVDEVDADLADRVEKFFFTTIPTAAELVLDSDTITGGCELTDATAENTTTTEVETEREVCVYAASDAAGAVALAGKEVTLTITGPGDFFNDANDSDVLDVGEAILGKTTSVTTAANGIARADIYSTEAGSSSVVASADTLTDTVTEVWTAGDARNIDCEPEEQDADPGTQAIVSCLVTDVFGNPTQDANSDGGGADTVTFTESGPGFLIGTNPAPVDVTGHAEIRSETGAAETGTQTVTGELDADVTPTDADDAADLDDPCDQPAGTTLAQEPGGAATGGTATAGNCEDSTEVNWEVQPVTECDDGIDNDFDGDIDFPADNGCADLDDDDESDEVVTETEHDVSISIDKFKKVKLGGGKKSLKVKGSMSSDFDTCINNTFMKLQLRAGGEWVTRKTDITNATGDWKVLIRHVKGRYRAVAPKFSIFGDDTIDTCLRAFDERRYK